MDDLQCYLVSPLRLKHLGASLPLGLIRKGVGILLLLYDACGWLDTIWRMGRSASSVVLDDLWLLEQFLKTTSSLVWKSSIIRNALVKSGQQQKRWWYSIFNQQNIRCFYLGPQRKPLLKLLLKAFEYGPIPLSTSIASIPPHNLDRWENTRIQGSERVSDRPPSW